MNAQNSADHCTSWMYVQCSAEHHVHNNCTTHKLINVVDMQNSEVTDAPASMTPSIQEGGMPWLIAPFILGIYNTADAPAPQQDPVTAQLRQITPPVSNTPSTHSIPTLDPVTAAATSEATAVAAASPLLPSPSLMTTATHQTGHVNPMADPEAAQVTSAMAISSDFTAAIASQAMPGHTDVSTHHVAAGQTAAPHAVEAAASLAVADAESASATVTNVVGQLRCWQPMLKLLPQLNMRSPELTLRLCHQLQALPQLA